MAKILIIDDNPEHAELLTAVLKTESHFIQKAATGKEAREKLKSFEPSLLIIDVFLGEENGRELCYDIKKENTNIAVILISVKAEALKDYKEYCANDIIEKPFAINHLIKKVNGVLALQNLTNSKPA